jgi:hydrogenase expression/formation protein HypC
MCLGIPGRVTEIQEVAGLVNGKVDFAGVSRQVCLAYVPDVEVGDYVLVHVGFALSLIDEAEAERTLEFVRSISGALEQELPAGNNPSAGEYTTLKGEQRAGDHSAT